MGVDDALTTMSLSSSDASDTVKNGVSTHNHPVLAAMLVRASQGRQKQSEMARTANSKLLVVCVNGQF
jgi:hypothetical protein